MKILIAEKKGGKLTKGNLKDELETFRYILAILINNQIIEKNNSENFKVIVKEKKIPLGKKRFWFSK